MNSVETIWLAIKNHLEQQKQQVNDEIFHYPPPIPACDAQFNYLLEKRAHLTQALQAVRELSTQEGPGNDPLKAIDELVRSCPYISETLVAPFVADLKAV